ncbi:hypothetical protein K456DRAFT_414854 [Colletotrichum gloeosporioides 23]|nr:hypothetical protein K456DRAFT_414854 [Colletotrichum gloeosporioides 23]
MAGSTSWVAGLICSVESLNEDERCQSLNPSLTRSALGVFFQRHRGFRGSARTAMRANWITAHRCIASLDHATKRNDCLPEPLRTLVRWSE